MAVLTDSPDHRMWFTQYVPAGTSTCPTTAYPTTCWAPPSEEEQRKFCKRCKAELPSNLTNICSTCMRKELNKTSRFAKQKSRF